MKKFTPKTLLVGLLVLTIAATSGAYAWFRATADGVASQVTAGKINLEGNPGCAINIDSILPGEQVDMGTHSVIYDGNRNAVIKFSVTVNDSGGSKSRILVPYPINHADWKALPQPIIDADYELKAGFMNYTEKRIKEIMTLRDAGIGNIHEGSDGNFYLMVQDTDSGLELANMVNVVFTGEFGGLFDTNKNGNLSDSRQFEQQSEFKNVTIMIEAVQITENAIIDTWGQDSLNEIAGIPALYSQLQAEQTWNLQ